MATKGLGDVIDIIEPLSNNLKLDIKAVSISTDDIGEKVLIETVDGKKYGTYSKVILDTVKKVIATKFDFKKDVLKAQVKEVESNSAPGQTYFTLINQK